MRAVINFFKNNFSGANPNAARASGNGVGPVIEPKSSGLGAFGGVFTPSILTILGVIMYLRFGWVVGNVGIINTLIIVTLSTAITFITALSISSIATDQVVRGGGAYYMISRSLGIEAGGAIGLPLFLAQALSVALYTIGFAESVVSVFPAFDQRLVGLVCVVFVALVALISAEAAIRVQYVIMAAIAASLISFLLGGPVEPTTLEFIEGAPAAISEPFWVVFAVFFPAVTGIMAGVNMSGDLRDPKRAIPLGTIAAVLVGYVIYMGLPLLLSMRADATTLLEEPFIMRQMARWGFLIVLGVWGATLSSAVGSILGAPRVLQALARDGVLPGFLRWLGQGSKGDDSPRLGTLLTFGLAFVAVFFGDLNVIAPILTMFFLTTYTVLNMVAGIETLLQSPSFRPSFRVHWPMAFLGAAGCIAVMFLINTVATIVAAILIAILLFWLEQRRLRAAWGDVRQGIWMAVTQTGIRHLTDTTSPKNWRPHILVLSGAPTQRWYLIELARALGHENAIMSVVTIVTETSVTPQRIESMKAANREYLERRGVLANVNLFRAEDPFVGTERFIQAYGYGPLVPNTVMLGDSKKPAWRTKYSALLMNLYAMQRNIIVVKENSQKDYGQRRRIDVWWGGLRGNGGLMMTLAYLLANSRQWRGATVQIYMVVADEEAASSARANLERLIGGSRTGAITKVIVAHKRPFTAILREYSAESDLVFLGMRAPAEGESASAYADYQTRLMSYAEGMPTTAFVMAAQDIVFGDILA